MLLNKMERYGLLVCALHSARPDLPHTDIVRIASLLTRAAKVIYSTPASASLCLPQTLAKRERAQRIFESSDTAKSFGWTVEYTPDNYVVLHWLNSPRPQLVFVPHT